MRIHTQFRWQHSHRPLIRHRDKNYVVHLRPYYKDSQNAKNQGTGPAVRDTHIAAAPSSAIATQALEETNVVHAYTVTDHDECKPSHACSVWCTVNPYADSFCRNDVKMLPPDGGGGGVPCAPDRACWGVPCVGGVASGCGFAGGAALGATSCRSKPDVSASKFFSRFAIRLSMFSSECCCSTSCSELTVWTPERILATRASSLFSFRSCHNQHARMR